MMKLPREIQNIVPDPKWRALTLCALISLLFLAAMSVLDPGVQNRESEPSLAASVSMERALTVLRETYVSRGLQFDDSIDPNHTGLIGVEYTDMVTTLGSADAKRSTTNPNCAGLIVRLFGEAGVKRGDTIAVGCSGSFPALAIATLAAAKALGVYPVVIISLGASSFGATRANWTLLDILESLKGHDLGAVPLAGISLGGSDDAGEEFEPDTRKLLIEKITSSGVPFIQEPDLQLNVAKRMELYFGRAGTRRIAAFVNIGGSQADLGLDPLILKLEPGVNQHIRIPEKEETFGVVFAMAKRHIEVIHLLHIKGLLLKYGLPWDPSPLPVVQTEAASRPPSSAALVAVTSLYVVVIVMVFVLYRKEFFRTSSPRSRL
jgi:poly-gamma-glutamate system protein